MRELHPPTWAAKTLSKLLGRAYSAEDVFRLIRDGDVEPYAMSGVVPLFDAEGVYSVGAALMGCTVRDFRHQVRTVREAVESFARRGVTREQLEGAVAEGVVPSCDIGGVVYIHCPTAARILAESN